MRQVVQKAGWVILGGIIQGFGMGVFLFPNFIPSGGAGGITVLLNYLFHIHTGLALWLVNFVLILVGMKYLGKKFVLWTTIGISVSSLSITFFESLHLLGQRNLFFDLIFGSFFLGVGIGILMKNNVSNGGIGVIAFIIAVKRNILPGKPLFIINCSIFCMTGIIITWEIIFLAFLSQWIATTIVDMIMKLNFNPPIHTLSWRKKI